MMQVDYIVIGIGLAGISFCEQLRVNKKTFVVFDNASQQSSSVAGGLYNPVVLKRFTIAWKAKEEMAKSLLFYKELSISTIFPFLPITVNLPKGFLP